VLWLLALLTILATAMTVLSVDARRHSEHFGEAAQVRESLDSAIRLTLLPWMASPNTAGMRSTTVDQEVAGIPIRVTIESDAGRIDLNETPTDLIAAYFEAAGWPAERAKTLAARIVDWRDPKDMAEALGAEAPIYANTGRRNPPRNGPFQSVGELRRVFGGEALDEGLVDGLTVYSRRAEPSRSECVPSVCAALNWRDRHLTAGADETTSREPPSSVTVSLQDQVSLIGEIIRVRACAQDNRHAPCRQLIGRLTGNTTHPLQVFEWQSSFN